MHLAFPFHFDAQGRTATVGAAYARTLIELVLFTAPGERVNRPTFGAGLRQLLFAPNSPELAAATEFIVQGALQQWLGDLVEVRGVRVTSADATLRVRVQYLLRDDQTLHEDEFVREGVGME